MKRIGLVCMLSVGISIPLAGDTGLFEAIRANDERAVASVVGDGVDANSRNQQGAPPLMQAALHASPGVMKLLLDHGADPNAHTLLGATALMFAAGDPAKVKVLLDFRAAVNTRANSGRNALIIASAYPENLQGIRMLLARGADPKAVDEAGDGPLGNAAGAADVGILKAFLAPRARVNERSNPGGPPPRLTPLMTATGPQRLETVP